MANVLGIGNAVLDIVLNIPHALHDDEELRANQRNIQIGGNVSNSLYVLSQLGHNVSLCSTTGGDAEAKQLLAGLKERQIDISHVQRFIKGRTPTSYVSLNAENGHRAIVHYRDLPELSFDHFAKIEIEDYDWLHFEGRNIENLKGMLNIAKTFLTYQPISLEVEKPRQGIEEIFAQANLIIFSHHYATAKGFKDGETLLTEVHSKHPTINLICTWGDKGAWLYESNGKIQHVPAEKVSPVLDTLGAGDTFNAAVIHHLIEGGSLLESVQQASQLAAKKCLKQGLDHILKEPEVAGALTNISQLSNSKTLVVQSKDLDHSVVLIKYEGEVKAYLNNCPHQDVPLNEAYKIDVNPFENTMKCSVHDAFFRIEDGVCIEGPCWNEALKELLVTVNEKGDIYLT